MFDRLYKVVIKHKKLEKGELIINGDSTKPSIDINFTSTINEGGGCSNGRISIIGLTEDHINRLAASQLYEWNQDNADANTVTLYVGWRDAVTGIKSKMVKILHGMILEATPGPLPERSLSISLCESNLDIELDKEDPTGDSGAKIFPSPPSALDESGFTNVDDIPGATPLKQYLNSFSKAWNERHSNSKIIVMGEFVDVEGKVIPIGMLDFPIDNKGLDKFLGQIPAKSKVLSIPDAENGSLQQVIRIADNDKDLEMPPIQVSQQTGMIGIPSATIGGCICKVVLKDVIMPGNTVHLVSNKFKILSSDDKIYSDGGDYECLTTTFNGQFRGNEWSQTLDLIRGDTVKEEE